MDIAKEKKSFLLYKDTLKVLDEMSDEKAGILFKAIAEYQLHKTYINLDDDLKLLFQTFVIQFKRDDDRYRMTSEKNRQNANKRWKKENATASDRMPPNANDTDSDSDSGSGSGSDSDSEIDKERDKDEIPLTNKKKSKIKRN